ncbi:hypothetical protein AC1031_001499 [Aphanomyces cochlioides]|nr:hypothetical protein AC1031_001499 [Aphanomyces cochlioides]
MKYYTDPQYEHPRVALDAMTSVKTAVEFEATQRPTKPPQGLTEDERTAWVERYEAQRKYSKLGELHESISNDYRARASAYLLAAVSPSLQSNIRHLDSPYRMYTWLLDHFQAHDPLDLLSMLHHTTYQAPRSQLQTHFDHMEALTSQLRGCILPASWTKLDVKAYDQQVWDALARLFLLHSFRSLDSIVDGLSYKSSSSLKEALTAMQSIRSNPIDPTPITPPATVPTTPPPQIRTRAPQASTSSLPPSAPSAQSPTEAPTARPTIIPAQAPSLASSKPPIVASTQPPTRIPTEVQSVVLTKPPIVASTQPWNQNSAPTTATVANPPSKEVPPPRQTASSPAEVAETPKNKIPVAVTAEPSPLPPPLEIPKPKRKPDDIPAARRPPKLNVPPFESPLNDNSWSIPKKAKPELPPPVDKPVLARRSSASNIETTNGTPPTLAPVLARRASTSSLKQSRQHDVGDGVDATGDNEAPNQLKRRRKEERASRWAPKTSPRLDIQAEPLLAEPPQRPPNELILDLNHVAVDEAAVSRCIYISQINHSVTEVTLTVLCNPFGVEIDQSTSYPRIDVFMCQRTRRPRGDATVYFKSAEGAQAAMNLLHGKRVKNTVLKARPMDVATLRLLQVQIYEAKPFWTCSKCRVQVSCWRNRCQACSGPRTFSPNGVELSATDWLCKL